jgi:hypothetical protein
MISFTPDAPLVVRQALRIPLRPAQLQGIQRIHNKYAMAFLPMYLISNEYTGYRALSQGRRVIATQIRHSRGYGEYVVYTVQLLLVAQKSLIYNYSHIWRIQKNIFLATYVTYT